MKITKFGTITYINDGMFNGFETEDIEFTFVDGEERSLTNFMKAMADFIHEHDGPELVVLSKDEYDKLIY